MFLNHILHKILHIDESMMNVAGVRLSNARLLEMVLERYFFKKEIVTFFTDIQNRCLVYYAVTSERVKDARFAMQMEAYREQKQHIRDNLDDIVQGWEDVAKKPTLATTPELPEVMREITVGLADTDDGDVKIVLEKHPIINLFPSNGMVVDL